MVGSFSIYRKYKYMEKNRIIRKYVNSHKCASDWMKLRDGIELAERYGASEKRIEFVSNLFTQADIRYEYFSESAIVAGFINNNAIVVKEEIAPDLESIKLDKSELKFVRQPQKDDKIASIRLLKTLGFEFAGTEIRYNGGTVDVLGCGKGKIIAVECGPCRINKAVDYLEKENTELWLIPVDFWQNKKFFIVSRGPNWKDFHDFHKKYQIKVLKTGKVVGI